MKEIKRFAAMLLVLVMTLNSMSLSAFAEDELAVEEQSLLVSDAADIISEPTSAAVDP